MKLIEFSLIGLLLFFSFIVNYYYGHQGLMPLDDLQNFNSGFRVKLGDFPFIDYFSITGPILDIWQSNIYKVFGVNWQSFVIHASIMNCLYSLSIFIFLKKLDFTNLQSFVFSLSGGLLMYPPTGNPTVEHNSLTLSIIALFCFIIGLKEKKNYFLIISIFIFCLSFFTKQVPTIYFVAFCILIYFTKIFSEIKISKTIFLILFSIFIFSIFIFYFLINGVPLINILNQYFIFASSLGESRFDNINFVIFYENTSKLFFLIFLIIPSIYFSIITRNFNNIFMVFGLSLIIIIYENHSQNQTITFSLLPVILALFYFFYNEEKLNNNLVKYFFYIIIIYAFYRILRYEILYILIFFILIFIFIFMNWKKRIISLNHLILIYLCIVSCFYFEKYVKIRSWDDLNKNSLSNSFDAYIIDKKLSNLKWRTVYFDDIKKEKKLIQNTLKFLKKLENSKYILISDYQIYNIILNKKDYSPVKYWFKDHTYPSIDHKLRSDFDTFFKKKIYDNEVSLIILDNTAEFKTKELKNFSWLFKCLTKINHSNKPKQIDAFLVDQQCLLN
jgi:hypothetical protein